MEYAAKAGSSNLIFFWMTQKQFKVIMHGTDENANESTQKVGTKKPSPWAL